MSPSPRDLLGLPLMAPRALQAAGDFLERLPDIEQAAVAAVERAQGALDQLLESVRPIETELEGGEAAATLEGQLAATERQIATTDRKVAELEGLLAQLIEVAIEPRAPPSTSSTKSPAFPPSAPRSGRKRSPNRSPP